MVIDFQDQKLEIINYKIIERPPSKGGFFFEKNYEL
jgi:hypothetical protein